MYNVKFLKGTASAYTNLTTKDANAFYYTTDDNNLYLGEIKLSNAADLTAALTRIATNESDITALETQLNNLVGSETGSIKDMIDTAIAGVNAKIGDLSTLNTTEKADLVKAINEVRASVSAGGTAAQITIDTTTTTEGAAKSYTIKQGKTTVGTIDIPKDMVVSAAEVRALTDEEVTTDRVQGTYIVLTIANATNDKLYINVGTLVDIYTAEENATQIQLTIDQSTNKISAAIVDGSVDTDALADNAVTTVKIADNQITTAKILNDAITSDKIADGAVTTDKLDSTLAAQITSGGNAVKDIATGATNGTIKVVMDPNDTSKDKEVAVKGLGGAAYVETSAFDAAGSATAAETNAKAYTDTALTWGTIESTPGN